MRFVSTPLEGAYLIEIEPRADERGFFARAFDRDELAAHGLDGAVAQCNLSFNTRRGTLRGMHYQLEPRAETKLVRCIAGAIYVSCAGRGGPHFGAPSAELAIVRHALGDVPLAGFFAAGEIARHHVYGYTGVLTVFRSAD